jgi:hypothetical protein
MPAGNGLSSQAPKMTSEGLLTRCSGISDELTPVGFTLKASDDVKGKQRFTWGGNDELANWFGETR